MTDPKAVLVPNNGKSHSAIIPELCKSRVNPGQAGNPKRLLDTMSSLAASIDCFVYKIVFV